MLMLVVLLVIAALALSGLLYAWTAWFQGYIYSEPARELYWRAPAAGAALALYLALWVLLDSRWPGEFQVFTQYASQKTSDPVPELKAVEQGASTPRAYRRVALGNGRFEYKSGDKALPGRVDKVIITEDGKEAVFEPERDAKGKYKAGANDYLIYRDARGRTMSEIALGQIVTAKGGGFWLNLFVNLLFGGVWFACLWLLLEFQWPHALVQAVVAWLVLVLFVVGPLLSYAERVATGTA
jgi:hypothetical protein